MSQVKKVVLAYSGGLDTSVIIPWLKENYQCEVIAMCADVGQGDELAPVRDKGLKIRGQQGIYSGLQARVCGRFHLAGA